MTTFISRKQQEEKKLQKPLALNMSEQRKKKLNQQSKQNYRKNKMNKILVPQGMASSAPLLPPRPPKGRKRQLEVEGRKGKKET